LRVGFSSYDKAGCIHRYVRLPERSDNPVAPTFGWAQVNEQHLVFIMVNDSRQRRPASNQIARRELALEYGVLQMVAIATHGLEDLAKALVVRNVVTDQI
jgi:hypothetical protein